MHSPTQEEVFGPSPFVTDPAPGVDGPTGFQKYNPIYFATPETAAKVAKMLGGTVEQANAIAPFGPFRQSQPNNMVRMPILDSDTEALETHQGDNLGRPIDPNGRLINPGIIADLFNHSHSVRTLTRLISEEVGFAWRYSPG